MGGCWSVCILYASYQVRGSGKHLVGVRCDIVSTGWVIAESIASNTGSGPIELLIKRRQLFYYLPRSEEGVDSAVSIPIDADVGCKN